MPKRESVRFAGNQLLQTLMMLGQELQKKQQMQQIAQARQGATSQVQVGATPIDFSRPNMGGGVRSVAPGMPQESILNQPSPFPMEQSLDRSKYLQSLLMLVSGNPMAKEEIGIQSAFLPKPFSASPGQVFGTQDPITMERKIQGQVPSGKDVKLPGGFAQMTPEAQTEVFNQTYKTNFPVSAFRDNKNDKLINAFPGEGNRQVAVFQRQDGSVYNEDLGARIEKDNAKIAERSKQLSALGSSLNQYKELLTKVPGGRIGGTASKFAGAVELNKEARAATGMENSLAGQIARVINGEVGVMTEGDIDRAKSFLPKILDNAEERKLKFDIIDRLIKERRDAYEAGNVDRIDVDAIEQEVKSGRSRYEIISVD